MFQRFHFHWASSDEYLDKDVYDTLLAIGQRTTRVLPNAPRARARAGVVKRPAAAAAASSNQEPTFGGGARREG